MLYIVIIELIQDASPIGDETSEPRTTSWVRDAAQFGRAEGPIHLHVGRTKRNENLGQMSSSNEGENNDSSNMTT